MNTYGRRAILASAMAAVLTACMTIGKKFDPALVDQLKPGVSTQRDAIELLGQPTSQSSMANGSTLLQWQYTQGTPVGGHSAHVAILFDKKDIMVRVTLKTVI